MDNVLVDNLAISMYYYSWQLSPLSLHRRKKMVERLEEAKRLFRHFLDDLEENGVLQRDKEHRQRCNEELQYFVGDITLVKTWGQLGHCALCLTNFMARINLKFHDQERKEWLIDQLVQHHWNRELLDTDLQQIWIAQIKELYPGK
jgi:hypothetical protein